MNLPQLYDYQEDLMARARALMARGVRKVLVQAATGAGKGVMAAYMMGAAAAKGVPSLFLAQRRNLVTQQYDRLRACGVPAGLLMNGHPRDVHAFAQVASRDTVLSRCVRNEWLNMPSARLVIVDEAHHLVNEYYKILDRYPDAYVVGFTATPAREDGRGLGEFFDALECAVPTSRLIDEGRLCPVKCYHPEYGRKLKPGDKRRLAGDPVVNWKRWAPGRPTILFAANRAACRAVVASFNAAGIAAEYLDAHTPDAERDDIVGRVRDGKTKVIGNVQIFTEGTDIPELACCINLRKCGSYVSFAQMVGRIMRAHPGKVDAVLIDHAAAVLEHGPPDEDVVWSLEPAERVEDRKKKERKESPQKKPIVCPACGQVFTGSLVCPGCAYRLLPREVPPALRKEMLVEMDRELPLEARRENRLRFWKRCLGALAHKGGTCGAAAAMYKKRFGAWPGEDGLPGLPVGNDWRRKVADIYPQYVRGGVL